MIDAPAIDSSLDVEIAQDSREEEPARWSSLAADVRFFAICYCAGLLVFLIMLS